MKIGFHTINTSRIMKKVIFIAFLLILFNVFCQTNDIERVSRLLETQTFFNIRLDYQASLTLPDSVKELFLIALSGNFTPRLRERMFTFEPWQKERFLEQSKQRCNGDSICIEQTFQDIIANVIETNYRSFMNRPISGHLILAAGSWNIKEAIPILENAIGNRRYSQRAVQMALARLGNDSIKQVLLERHTLSYILQTTSLDTINDNARIEDGALRDVWRLDEGIQTAVYLQSQEMLLNILDLIYIRGLAGFCVGSICSYSPYVARFVFNFVGSFHFSSFPNIRELRNKECIANYSFDIWYLHGKRRNRREQRELDRLLSTEYRTMIKNQIRDWIIENVNFE